MEPLMSVLECLESQVRARSNTWPQPRPENYKELDLKKENNDSQINSDCVSELESKLGGSYPSVKLSTATTRKNSPRRNAWGDLSYADLITQAITSAPEKRLTLSQIYDWMVQNVPYFKARADANCSAGWKNSIRHNLSLHNKFMRCQNEGPGRSSWWMINPDAKPGKASRRRAASMETGKFEKRRGRVKKRVEVLRNRLRVQDTTQSPSSSISESSDLFPDSPIHSSTVYQLNTDFRSRVSSSASSSGHLSPIPCSESEWIHPTSYSSTYISEELVRTFDENLELQNNGIIQKVITISEKPPEPTSLSQPPVETLCWSLSHPASPFSVSNCQIHGVQPCTCSLTSYTQESYSSSDFLPPNELSTNSPTQFDPLESISNQRVRNNPTTAMGQIMDVLNHSTSLDDLNINIETFHGGFDCNVDEVIRHELSMGSTLDFNFSHNQTRGEPVPNSSNSWNI